MLGQVTCLYKVEASPHMHVSLVVILLFSISEIFGEIAGVAR
jgi:hypothetical protein